MQNLMFWRADILASDYRTGIHHIYNSLLSAVLSIKYQGLVAEEQQQ